MQGSVFPQEAAGGKHTPIGYEAIEALQEHFHTPLSCTYSWNYEIAHAKLKRLYELGKKLNWDASIDLDWSLELDWSVSPIPADVNPYAGFDAYEAMSPEQQLELNWHRHAWSMSQFLHGEQGALMVASQLVSCAPTHEAKLYAASQTFDEARHVEVFSRYVTEKLGFMYPVNDNLKKLLDSILTDERWDLKFIGMQIIIEGLALAAFNTMKSMSQSPLLTTLLDGVIQDEARHVAFGVIFLEEFVKALPEHEREQRAQFAFEACVIMRDRLIEVEVFKRFGWDPELGRDYVLKSQIAADFRSLMFKRIVPNLKRIGLLTDAIKPSYDSLGLLSYESMPDDADVQWSELEKSVFNSSGSGWRPGEAG